MTSQVRDLEDPDLAALSCSSSSGARDVSKEFLNLLFRGEFRDLFRRMEVVEGRSSVVDGVVVEGESGSEDGFE